MSLPTLEFHPQAIAEARAARKWYATRSENAADAFVAELDRAVARIIESPSRWPAHVHGTRRYLLRRFPFSLVYRVTGSVITVVAVSHGKRRPGYWKTR